MNDDAPRRQSQPTLLIVNDEPETLEVLTIMLQNEGYCVFSASSGEEALVLAEQVQPDLVISDIVMPGLDGIELCRLLKSNDRTADVPVLLASARGALDDEGLRGLEAGADDFLEMPFRLQELLIKAARLVERSRVERHYRDLVEQAADIIFTQDKHGRITSINRAGANFFGRPAANLIGLQVTELFGEPQETALPAEETRRNVHRVVDAARSVRYLEVITTPFHDARGQVAGMRGIARDITERKALEKYLARQVEREAIIGRITRAVHRSLDPAEVFRAAVVELGQALEADRCVLFIPDEATGTARGVAEYSAPGVSPPVIEYSLKDLAGLKLLIERRGFIASDDVANDPRLQGIYENVLRPSGIRSVLYVAVKVGDDLHGAFAVSKVRELRCWSEMDIALAQSIAEQTGLAIRQAQLYQRATAASMREALINRLGQAIRASLNLPEVLSAATHELGRTLAASRVDICLYAPGDETLKPDCIYAADRASERLRLQGSYQSPIAQRLMTTLQPVIVADAEQEKDPQLRQRLKEHGVRSTILFPLVFQGNFRGLLRIFQLDRPRRWTEDEIALIEAVATQLATGIAHAELFGLVTQAKREWEATFDAMSDGIFIFDLDKRLVRVNRAGAALEDSWPHLLIGRRCCDVLRATDQTCLVERALRERRRLTREYVPESSLRPLLVTAEPLVAAQGQIMGVICTARDLTELREAQAAARQQQRLLVSVLQSAREAIYAVDVEGRLLWCNRAIFELTGCAPPELIGRSIFDFIHEEDRTQVEACLQKTFAGQAQSCEARYRGADGWRYALINSTPLRLDEKVTGSLCFAHDVTEQKQQTERLMQAEKLRALGQLASGVAHDFNNALAAIMGRAQLMRRRISDPKLLQSLDVIQKAAEDAAATARRIQTFARQAPLEKFERLELGSLVLDAIEITRTRWEDDAFLYGWRYDVATDVPPGLYVSGNASELREVFVNLIINAIDAMPRGGTLKISARREDGEIVLRLTDQGIGIQPEVLGRIFEPFYTTKGAQGTGLGLFVSYGIIERHRGRIEVESKVGHGTTFVIRLPAAHAGPSLHESREIPQSGSLCVLVADDEPAVRETLADMLTAMNHKVVEVDGGRAAFAALAMQPFDIVFTDLSMPEIDGWQIARTVRRHQPEIGIVLVTGYGHEALSQVEDKDLVDGIIAKPFDFEQIAEVLASVMARRRMHMLQGSATKDEQ